MKKHFVIKNQPVKLPILGTAFYTFLMDYYGAPQWAWGVFITVFVLIWILMIILLWNQESVDLFADNNTPEKLQRVSKFQTKLAEAYAKAKAELDKTK